MKDSTLEKYKLVIEAYYQNGMNGTKAVESVYGKKDKQLSKNQWNRIQKAMITNDYLLAHSELHKKELQDSFSHNELLGVLRSWLYSDITTTLSLSPDEVKDLPENIRQLISGYKHSVTTFEGGEKEVFEVKFIDKKFAADAIAKHIGFYKETTNPSQTNNVQINVNFV